MRFGTDRLEAGHFSKHGFPELVAYRGSRSVPPNNNATWFSVDTARRVGVAVYFHDFFTETAFTLRECLAGDEAVVIVHERDLMRWRDAHPGVHIPNLNVRRDEPALEIPLDELVEMSSILVTATRIFLLCGSRPRETDPDVEYVHSMAARAALFADD